MRSSRKELAGAWPNCDVRGGQNICQVTIIIVTCHTIWPNSYFQTASTNLCFQCPAEYSLPCCLVRGGETSEEDHHVRLVVQAAGPLRQEAVDAIVLVTSCDWRGTTARRALHHSVTGPECALVGEELGLRVPTAKRGRISN